jgi:hypothetical protein
MEAISFFSLFPKMQMAKKDLAYSLTRASGFLSLKKGKCTNKKTDSF